MKVAPNEATRDEFYPDSCQFRRMARAISRMAQEDLEAFIQWEQEALGRCREFIRIPTASDWPGWEMYLDTTPDDTGEETSFA